MIDKTRQLIILQKILSSKDFKASEKYNALLTYLVKASLEQKRPKEYSIAVDVFGRDKSFNPAEDTIVRYYMHRLRQKIKNYYEHEGRNDEVWLSIPKGHYEVKFIPRPEIEDEKEAESSPWNRLVFILLIFSLLISTYLYIQNSHLEAGKFSGSPVAIAADDPFWSSFFDNSYQTTLLIGDHFLYKEKEENRDKFIVDYRINNTQDFTRYKNERPGRQLEKMEQGSLPLNSIYNLNDLSRVFYSFNRKINIKLTSVYMSSQFDVADIAGQNIIYIGGFRNLRKFNYILENIGVTYRYSEKDIWRGTISIETDGNDKPLVFKSEKLKDGYYTDLGVIARVRGSKMENYLILAGFAYPAQIDVVRIMSNSSTLKRIYEQSGYREKQFPDKFIMVVQVDGLEYSALDWRVKYFKALE
ncbi:MAG TPA: hypothetical protein ENJ10_08730 [Caldithrix abyssi]|uniref:Uncharacterized protein n=1 Tax=Caldithrix abyssi TaxID=187145 RepID=A0A7V1LMM3_CALAY|nr:hypothetical protein [Caldithrix abyssi]